MGGVMNRSSIREDEKYFRTRKDKRTQQHQNFDISFESDYEYIYRDVDSINTYDLWDKKFDQKQMTKINAFVSIELPDVSNIYSSYNSTNKNDIRNQTWQFLHDANNSLYSTESRRITPSYNISYNPNEYIHAQVPDTIKNQSQTVTFDERLPKRGPFASSSQQQQQKTLALKPLASTQSWHESSITSNNMSVSRKRISSSNRSSTLRSLTSVPSKPSAQAPVQKAIYVTIDYTATLAERGQTVANEYHRKNGERYHSDGSNSSTNNHRIRSRVNHRHKHQHSTDLCSSSIHIPSSKSLDTFQAKLSGSQHTIPKSMSTNRLAKNIEQMPFINNETKQFRSRSHHRQQSLQTNQVKPSKSRENHQQHKRQHHSSPSNELSFPIESSIRRIDNKHSNRQMMRIPLSQHNY
ncbi:unnamed protein product [Rotaria sp. Silwood1]|nr:unnamed protein product [Rotaria sp. Silwood1]CAF3382132.1 unnamed protein product [Rotaria sp. Silwood1]